MDIFFFQVSIMFLRSWNAPTVYISMTRLTRAIIPAMSNVKCQQEEALIDIPNRSMVLKSYDQNN